MYFIRLEYDFEAQSLGPVEVAGEVFKLATVAPSGLMKADRIWLKEMLEALVVAHGRKTDGTLELTRNRAGDGYQVVMGGESWAVEPAKEGRLEELLEAFHAHLIIEA